MKFYRCITTWKRHSVGEVIPEYEYNKLPFEIKQHKNFELIDNVAIVETIPVPIIDSPNENAEAPAPVEILITSDAEALLDAPTSDNKHLHRHANRK